MSEKRSTARFPTTQWSRVLLAGSASDGEGRDALEQLCRDYWYPLHAFARRRGLDREEAGDLVQGFLADLLERGDLTNDTDRWITTFSFDLRNRSARQWPTPTPVA